MLILCLHCPTALCYDCFPPNFRRVHPSPTFWNDMSSRGWKVTDQKAVFFTCNACRALEEQQKRQQMRKEDLEAQQDDKKRAALEEKRSLAAKRKQRDEEEVRRRMRMMLLEHERSELAQRLQRAKDEMQHAAEQLWPPRFRTRWLACCEQREAKAKEAKGASAPKSKRSLWCLDQRSALLVCGNCGFPGHRTDLCPLAPEKVTPSASSSAPAKAGGAPTLGDGSGSAIGVAGENEEDDDEVRIVGTDGAVGAKDDEGKAKQRAKRCGLCGQSTHSRVMCTQLSAEQRTEYLERIEHFRQLASLLKEVGAGSIEEPTIPLPAKGRGDEESPALTEAWRRLQEIVQRRANEVLEQKGFERLLVRPPPDAEPNPKGKAKAKAKLVLVLGQAKAKEAGVAACQKRPRGSQDTPTEKTADAPPAGKRSKKASGGAAAAATVATMQPPQQKAQGKKQMPKAWASPKAAKTAAAGGLTARGAASLLAKAQQARPSREERVLVDGEAAGWTIHGFQNKGVCIFKYRPPGEEQWFSFMGVRERDFDSSIIDSLARERGEIALRFRAAGAASRSASFADPAAASAVAPQPGLAGRGRRGRGSRGGRGGRGGCSGRSGRGGLSAEAMLDAAVAAASKAATPQVSPVPPPQQVAMAREVIKGPASGWVVRGKLDPQKGVIFSFRAPGGKRWQSTEEARIGMEQAAWDALTLERENISEALKRHLAGGAIAAMAAASTVVPGASGKCAPAVSAQRQGSKDGAAEGAGEGVAGGGGGSAEGGKVDSEAAEGAASDDDEEVMSTDLASGSATSSSAAPSAAAAVPAVKRGGEVAMMTDPKSNGRAASQEGEGAEGKLAQPPADQDPVPESPRGLKRRASVASDGGTEAAGVDSPEAVAISSPGSPQIVAMSRQIAGAEEEQEEQLDAEEV